MDIMKALLLFALGFYLGKYWLEFDMPTLSKAKSIIDKVQP